MSTLPGDARAPASLWHRWLVLLLRLASAVMAFSLTGVLMPRSAMDAIHNWLGLGELPKAPVVEYLARTLALMYAMQSGLAWVISTDVWRFLPILNYVICFGFICTFGIPVICRLAGMPWSWVFGDGLSMLLLNVLLLFLKIKMEKEERPEKQRPAG